MPSNSEWTVATLKEHFDVLRQTDQEAIKVALELNNKRLDGQNEWRGQSKDREAMFVTKAEFRAVSMAIGAIGVLLLAVQFIQGH